VENPRILTYLTQFANAHDISIVDPRFFSDIEPYYQELIDEISVNYIEFIVHIDEHTTDFCKLPKYYKSLSRKNAENNAKFIYNIRAIASG
jgi:hypothetical protein